MTFFRRVYDSLNEYWQSQERSVKVRFIAISGVALVGIAVAVTLLLRVEYTVLFDTDVSESDIGAAQTALTAAGIRSKTQNGQLLVDVKQKYAAADEMSRLQIPAAGYDYSGYERASGFSVSESERRTWNRVQIQMEMNKRLATSPKIKSARVEYAQPDNSYALYTSEKTPVTASVMLELLEGLNQDEINGVVDSVAYAWPGLDSNNVVVVDQYMNILNRGEPTDITQITQQHEMELTIQADLNRAVLSLLQPAFGANRVKVASKVTLDFDEKSTEKVTRTPVVDTEGIVVSMRETIEKATGYTPSGGRPGGDENGGDTPDYAETGNATSSWSSTAREMNYEINEQIDKLLEAKGKLADLTISITIDSNALPEDEQNIRNIQTIAAGPLGLAQAEFNRINVLFLPFHGVEEEQRIADQIAADERRSELYALIRVLALYLVLLICLVLLIQRVYKFFHREEPEDEMLRLQEMADMEQMDEYADLLKLTATPEDLETVKSPERLKVEDFVERNPEMVANLLRNWLSEEVPRGRR